MQIQRPRETEKDTVVGGRSEQKSRRRASGGVGARIAAMMSTVIARPRLTRLSKMRFDAAEFTSRRRATRLTARTAAAWTASMFATWLVLFTVSERWLPATMLAYGPRWVVLLPLVLLLPLALVFARKSVAMLAVGAVIALWPVMGFRLALPTAGISPPAVGNTNQIRVLSLNAKGGGIVTQRLASIIERYTPGIIAMQECGDELAAALERQRGWHAARYGGLCTLSRWPIMRADTMPRAAFARVSQLGYGGSGIVVRYHIAHPRRPFEFVNLHLETARKGLESVLGDDGLIPDDASELLAFEQASGVDQVDDNRVALNARIRRSESERASVWSARKMDEVPIIIAGDFNMPVESSIYRRYWSDLTNAFDTKGLGFGFTKHEGSLLHLRIDHVLSAPKWFRVRGAWVGMDVGSDHRPVIVDLTLR